MFATWVGPVHPGWNRTVVSLGALTARMVAVRTVLRAGEYLDAGLDPHHDQEWLEIGGTPTRVTWTRKRLNGESHHPAA